MKSGATKTVLHFCAYLLASMYSAISLRVGSSTGTTKKQIPKNIIQNNIEMKQAENDVLL